MLSSLLTDRIEVASRDLSAVIGILPHERTQPQPLDLRLELYLDTRRAAYSGEISHTLDYSVLFAEACFLLQACEFHLLETAAETLARYLLFRGCIMVSDQLSGIRICLTKTAILAGQTRVSLTIERSREEFDVQANVSESEALPVIEGRNPVYILQQARSFPSAIKQKPYILTVGLHGERTTEPVSADNLAGNVFVGSPEIVLKQPLSVGQSLAVGIERLPLCMAKTSGVWNIYQQPILS